MSESTMPPIMKGSRVMKPAMGPATPMSNRAAREGNGSRILMTGPQSASPDQRHRDEEGECAIDIVPAAGKVVPELMGAQDQQNGKRIPESSDQPG